ncbi:WD40-repeat-containing domain protein [Tirmania nivea]|nr:WD40-repeat-containing domain protein [Tirmania nivea]
MASNQQPPQAPQPGAQLPPPPQQQQQQQRGQNPAEAQNLNQIVIEYLSKKGYSRTEAMLRVESAHIDADGRPIISRVEDYPDMMHEKAYSFLKNWIENSLDLYKPELRRILFPVFVYSFLELASKGFVKACQEFFEAHSPEHESLHAHDLSQLMAIRSMEHVQHNELAKLYKENKYRISLTRMTFNLLTYHLHDNEAAGGDIIIRFLNNHIDVHIITGHPTTLNARDESGLGEDEGIVGHTTGRRAAIGELASLKLGPLPMDKEFIADVEERLQQEDANERQQTKQGESGIASGVRSLMDEFKAIKREETEDSPMRDDIPLPPYKGTDIERELRMVKESRQKFNLISTPSPALPSVCMYTFHNTNDGLACVDFSQDATLAATGFQEAYIKIFSLTGNPLVSALPSENNGQTAPTTRRLIAHSGPVYGVTFSPDNRYIISSSQDSTVRLWSLDTFTGLVLYKGHDRPIWDVKFGPFGHYFATASHDHTARLWSTDHIYPLRIFAGHLSDVDTLAWHPNSAYLATGSSDKTVRLWDVQRGASVRLFNGHTAPVTALAFSPDGRTLASAADDATINLWDIGSGKKLKSMRGHGKTSIYGLDFSVEGAVLVSGGADNTVRVWDVNKGLGGKAAAEPEPYIPASAAASAAVNAAAAVTGDTTMKVDAPVGAGVTSQALAPSTTGGKKKKEIIATPDHMAAFHTKRTPVYRVRFTPRNLVLAAGAYVGS